tara:strand:+ start:12300 stop:12416 length:117 start_codon:yes stop_codon:yes gene_type:complete
MCFIPYIISIGNLPKKSETSKLNSMEEYAIANLKQFID